MSKQRPRAYSRFLDCPVPSSVPSAQGAASFLGIRAPLLLLQSPPPPPPRLSSTSPAVHRCHRRAPAPAVDRRRLLNTLPCFGAFARRHVAVLAFLASTEKQLPCVIIHLFLGTNGSHCGLVTESKLRLAVDGLMTASALHLGPCAKNMFMFAIAITVCCSLFFLFLRFLWSHQNQPARTRRFPPYRCTAGRLHYNL